MKSLILETLPTAVLVGAEAFFIGAGAVWVILWQAAPRDVWIWPAMCVETLSAIIGALALFRSAFLAAAAETEIADGALPSAEPASAPNAIALVSSVRQEK